MSEIPPLSELALSFKPGIYRHFKGGLYEALMVGRNSEQRDEEYIIYRSIEKGYVWIRPIEMFFETVDRDGYNGPRFIWVKAL